MPPSSAVPRTQLDPEVLAATRIRPARAPATVRGALRPVPSRQRSLDGEKPPRPARSVAEPAPDPAPTPEAPSERTLRALALSAFEVLEGMRTVAQLGPWITEPVAQQLRERRALRTELRTLTRDVRCTVAEPGRAHITRTGAAIEAVVVLHAASRSHAVALRLEVLDERWRASDLTVL